MKPSISEKYFIKNGFELYKRVMDTKGGGENVWSECWWKRLGSPTSRNILEVQWYACGKNHYEIHRDFPYIIHCPCFVGNIESEQQFDILLTMIDLSIVDRD